MKKLHADGLFKSLDYESLDACEPCLMGKMTKTLFSGTMERATYLWYCRLGRIGVKHMKKLHVDGLLESLDYESLDACEPCLMGKMTKTPFSGTMERATDLLGIIHTDVCGPMSVEARGGYRYFLTFTDDLRR